MVMHKDIQGGVDVSPLGNFNYSRWPPWTQKSSENALLDFIKGTQLVNMSCNNVCLSIFIQINLFTSHSH